MGEPPFDPSEYVALFFDLFETTSDVAFILRIPGGEVVAVNAAALRLFGWTRAAAVGGSRAAVEMWADLGDWESWLEDVRRQGRVTGVLARFCDHRDEEITLALSGSVARFRGSDAVLGVGTIAPTR